MLGKESKQTRGQIVKVLYNCALKFLKYRGTAIHFKEVFLNYDRRVDLLSIGWDEKVVIIELKTCRDDFTSDHKYKEYLLYCHYFYFMSPPHAIEKEDIPNNIGLIWVTGDLKKQSFQVIQAPRKLKNTKLDNSWYNYQYKKMAFRKYAKVDGKLIELEEERFFDK